MRLALLLVSSIGFLLSSFANPAPAAADNCQFVLGFKVFHDLIPDIVGNCLVNEHHNPTNGDGLQETTGRAGAGGLLVWRKADNWTAFTDGYRTWVNGPLGLQERLNTERFPWEKPQTLQVAASGYGQIGAQLGYGVVITNPNPNVTAVGIAYQITVYNPAGQTLASDAGSISSIAPGGQLELGGQVSLPGNVPVGRIGVQVTPSNFGPPDAEPTLTGGSATYFSSICCPTVSGLVHNSSAEYVKNVRVSAIAYDANGAIVGGGNSWVATLVPNGQALVNASIYVSSPPAKVELYPQLTSTPG